MASESRAKEAQEVFEKGIKEKGLKIYVQRESSSQKEK